MNRIYQILLVLLLLLIPFCSIAQNKVALIIGNSRYQVDGLDNLSSCVNDANAMDSCLKNLGYKTIVYTNATREDIQEGIERVADIIKKDKTTECVLYYSGHSIGSSDNRPFLIPSGKFDAKLLGTKSVFTGEILDFMKMHCKHSIFFLDGCRTQPDKNTSEIFKDINFWKPDSVKYEENGNEQVCLYATKDGEPALPGNYYSPFTRALITHLFDKESFMEKVWPKIVAEVKYETKGKQEPINSGWIGNEFMFNISGVNPYCKVTLNVHPDAKINFDMKEYKSGEEILIKKGRNYYYEIEHEGYEKYIGKIRVETKDTNTHIYKNIYLDKLKNATLRVKCLKPKHAEVYIDDVLKGTTPLTITTTSGYHEVKVVANRYYINNDTIKLAPEENKSHIVKLERIPPQWFKFNRYDKAVQINYHFSPKNRFILSSMYRNEYTRWSFGAIISLHGIVHRIFGEGDDATMSQYSNQSSTITFKSSKDTVAKEETYNINAGLLWNVGYSFCNGVMIEAGVGGYYHEERYSNKYTTTSEMGNNAGNSYNEMQMSQTTSQWSSRDAKWSPAVRLGARCFIPLDEFDTDSYSISLGGGYTYLPMNHKCSFWDVSIGLCWYF